MLMTRSYVYKDEIVTSFDEQAENGINIFLLKLINN